ncbi:MAG: 7-cyano-7-deazaguanine synthase QueC [Nitrospirae bacterium]|nr:7-cyano-7-deazaguanine synthase QueC [Nitrospirota bacterium]
MKNELAVVLVSGGMDSCVAAAIANEEYRLAFLHVNYGQRTEARELQAFNEIADHYKAEKRLTVSIEHLKVIGGSSLTDTSIPVPELGSPQSAIHNPQSAIPNTYVPFRNAHLLSIAVSWAEVIGATKIFIGAVEEDSSGYPDCREVFYRAFNKVIEMGTKPETRIEIITPLIHLKKSAIVQEGMKRRAPLHLSWSCYQNNDRACGRCESCILRLKGFTGAGVDDPIPYEEIPHEHRS